MASERFKIANNINVSRELMMYKNVKKELINQDLTLRDLAILTGYKFEYLSSVINGHVDSRRAKERIALALQKDFGELWDGDIVS